MDPSIRALEDLAFAAWPAEQVRALGSWRLRFTRGVTRRANSVWTCAPPGQRPGDDRPLDTMVDQVEAFYAERSQPALFQLSPLTTPVDLDRVLAGRGYLSEAPVAVQVAASDRAAAAPPAPASTGPRVVIEPRLFPTWFEISGRRGRFAEVAEVYRELLGRLEGRAVYALAELGGQPAAVGLGVAERGWMGIFSMTTLAPFRRRGAGRAVLTALARHACTAGLPGLYLQVERDNGAAAALYTAAGFSEAYGYHYRRQTA